MPLGCAYRAAIVGISFGRQLFKMTKLPLLPFGTEARVSRIIIEGLAAGAAI